MVDDREVNRDLLGYLLRALGHQAFVVGDGEAAVVTARRELPDLVIVDLAVPGIDGYELARRIRADPLLASVVLVAVSATSLASSDLARAAGFDAFHPYPIEPEDFVRTLEGWLRGTGEARP